ncbi:hypothetical protein [Hyalangium sp.]|uniref:hypothetical protein n=1 Tax=Hyalangium sp. TaxID=2028555 RepID=UPI002D53B4C2|nr:hypothetical protein [Hyalangium sp.]HYI02144.1 hypothetical protein [Hyalangium sp.]
MDRHGAQLWVLLGGLLVGPPAVACPDCPTARVVRTSVLGDDFWTYLVTAVVPFLLIGALSALLYRIGLPPREVATPRDGEEPGART